MSQSLAIKAPFQSDLFGIQKVRQKIRNTFKKREVDGHLIALILAHSDISIDLDNGCIGLKISKTQAMSKNLARTIGDASNDICDIVVIWNEWTSSIVNVLHQNLHIDARNCGQLH